MFKDIFYPLGNGNDLCRIIPLPDCRFRSLSDLIRIILKSSYALRGTGRSDALIRIFQSLNYKRASDYLFEPEPLEYGPPKHHSKDNVFMFVVADDRQRAYFKGRIDAPVATLEEVLYRELYLRYTLIFDHGAIEYVLEKFLSILWGYSESKAKPNPELIEAKKQIRRLKKEIEDLSETLSDELEALNE